MAAATLWRMRWDDDMEPAIALAREAAADGEVPVGAVVLAADGQVIGRGRNLRETPCRSACPRRSQGDG